MQVMLAYLVNLSIPYWLEMSRQISAVLDLCCIVTRRSVESVGGVFDPDVSWDIAVFEHVKDELAVMPCLLQATLEHVRQEADPSSSWGATGMAAPSPLQSTVQCECNQQQLHAALTLSNCRLEWERERVGKDKGIRGSSVQSLAEWSSMWMPTLRAQLV